MSDSNPYQGNPQDPYSGGQYGDQQQSQQPQTVYGSYGEQPSYQSIPQPNPYGSPAQQQYPQYQQYPPVQNPGYGQQQAPYYAMPNPTASEPGSALAIAGLIVGVIAIFTSWFPFFGLLLPIVGIILSALGRRSVSRRVLATVGLVLSIIALVISLIVIILIFVAAAHNNSSSSY